MRLVWKSEIQKFGAKKYTIHVADSSAQLKKYSNQDILIVSYGLVPKNIPWFKTFEFLVCDEAHYLKNMEAQRTQAVLRSIWSKCKSKIMLSGTPMMSSVVDIFPVAHKICPDLFPDFHKFANRYTHVRFTQYGVIYVGVKNGSEISSLLRSNFFVRYRKEEVLTELPDKIFQEIMIPEKFSVRKAINRAEKSKSKTVDLSSLGEGLGTIKTTMHDMAQRRLQSLAKVPFIVEYAEEMLSQEIPLLIFAHHIDVIKGLADGLKKYKPGIISGLTNAAQRHAALTNFQEGRSDLLLLNLQAGGVGITATRACNVLLAEVADSPSVIAQAVDRVHRIGQKNQVIVHYFVVEKSDEADTLRSIIAKASSFKVAMGDIK
jgi:SWI/SNF-related matrix-associated actin-dependent regulator 1 of chromatin subfamily A